MQQIYSKSAPKFGQIIAIGAEPEKKRIQKNNVQKI